MGTTDAEFADHVRRLHAFVSLDLNEAETRYHLVDPVIRMLGYSHIEDVRREISTTVTKELLDYELFAEGHGQAVVEAKALKYQLTPQHAAQAVQYASVLGVRWCLITNGATWEIYYLLPGKALADMKIVSVSLRGDNEQAIRAWSVLSLFSRDTITRAPQRLLLDRVVAAELSRPNSSTIAALRRVAKDSIGNQIPGQAIIEAIARVCVSLISSSSAAETEFAQQHPADMPKLPPAPHPKATSVSKGQLGALIAAGLLPSDATLTCKVRGITHTAQLRDGELEIDGKRYRSPSSAASELYGTSINGLKAWRHNGISLHELRAKMT